VKIIDISVPVQPGMITYEGDPQVHLERALSIAQGDVANVSRLDLGVHTGTHIDAPLHFVDRAADTESIALDVLVGPAHVVDATRVEQVLDEESLRGLDLPAGAERLLFKTQNSSLWELDEFSPDFVHLTGDGARYLIERGTRLVGIDYLSVGDEAAHRELLGAGIAAVEGLDLRSVEAGEYQLVCLPLRLVGSDGAPARAVLISRTPGR
jgi:arylformamidase